MSQQKTKSPFIIVQEFISPLQCEDIVDHLNFLVPDVDKDDKPQRTIKHNDFAESLIYERLEPLIETIESHYDTDYHGTEKMEFEWYPEDCDGLKPHCENSNYVRNQWLKTKNNDFTGVIFFSDFQPQVPFDGEFEVYGGKLEFPQHQFGFNPERGTLIIFPSGPHFINNTMPILAGDSFQVRFHIAVKTPFLYQPDDFPGDYVSWLEKFA